MIQVCAGTFFEPQEEWREEEEHKQLKNTGIGKVTFKKNTLQKSSRAVEDQTAMQKRLRGLGGWGLKRIGSEIIMDTHGGEAFRTYHRPCRPYHPYHPCHRQGQQGSSPREHRRWQPRWYPEERQHRRHQRDQCGQP